MDFILLIYEIYKFSHFKFKKTNFEQENFCEKQKIARPFHSFGPFFVIASKIQFLISTLN